MATIDYKLSDTAHTLTIIPLTASKDIPSPIAIDDNFGVRASSIF